MGAESRAGEGLGGQDVVLEGEEGDRHRGVLCGGRGQTTGWRAGVRGKGRSSPALKKAVGVSQAPI